MTATDFGYRHGRFFSYTRVTDTRTLDSLYLALRMCGVSYGTMQRGKILAPHTPQLRGGAKGPSLPVSHTGLTGEPEWIFPFTFVRGAKISRNLRNRSTEPFLAIRNEKKSQWPVSTCLSISDANSTSYFCFRLARSAAWSSCLHRRTVTIPQRVILRR